MKTHLKKTILVLFILAGCGEQSPHQISGIDNFPEEQQAQILDAIDQMNTRAGRTIVTTEEGGYPIQLNWLEESEAKSLGFAYTDLNSCKIEISDEILALGSEGLMTAVIWHELGHCMGLGHDEEEGEIMFKVSYHLFHYAPEAIDRFFQRLLDSVNIH